MAFAIMRAVKLKSMGSVASSLQCCYRDRETPNADEERTRDNQHLAAGSTGQAMEKLRELLPEKRRKDAVLVVEYLMSASPEWWETASKLDQFIFFSNSLEWIEDKYGKENIITATVHRDELTPHLSAFVVPITTDGRLSAKEFIGNRTKMSQDQTTYASKVKSLGLERGIEGSTAKHQRVKSYYAALQEADRLTVTVEPYLLKPHILRKGVFRNDTETPYMVAERLSKIINKAIKPMVEKAFVSAQEVRNAESLRKSLDKKKKRIEELMEPFKGLSKNQIAKVIEITKSMKEENERENAGLHNIIKKEGR